MSNIEIYKKALAREKQARKLAEKIIEDKSLELYNSNKELKRINKSIEEEVHDRTAEIQDLFDNMYDGYITLDDKGTVTKSNKAARIILGYEPNEEIKNLSLKDIVHEDDLEHSKQNIDLLFKQGFYSNYVGRVYDKQGNIKYLEVNSNAIYDENKNIIGSRDIIRDVTQKTIAKKELAISEERMRAVFDNKSVGIAIFNKNGGFVSINQTFQEQLGHEEEYFMTKVASRILHPEDIKNYRSLMDSIYKNEIQETQVESRYLRKSGEVFWANSNISGVYDENNKLLYFIVMAEDITARKIAEEKLQKSLGSLEVANRDLKDFAHVVSHDLKAPLRSISGLVQILQEDYKDKFDEDGKQIVEDVITRTEHMDELIGGILSYSSVNNSDEKRKRFESKDIIEKLLKYVEVPEHVAIEVVGKFPELHMNPTHFQQLIQNFITNAIKYNDKEKGEITLRSHDDDLFYNFSVEDNGRGISERNQDKIFNMFQKFDTEGRSSSGIGLAIVKKIVELYQGKVSLQSEVGKGSIFTFHLPKDLL